MANPSSTSQEVPKHIPFAAVPRYVWGDRESGEVADWVYVDSAKIHMIVFGLAPGGWFRHSRAFPTIFAADELYYVLSGTLLINNPQTGEVHRATPGEAVFFRRDTWHYGFNHGTELLRVLEFFAPPPAAGAAGDYAKKQPDLKDIRTAQDQFLTRWPMAQSEASQNWTMRVLRDRDALVRLEGAAQEALVELFISTEHLSVGRMSLLPGRQSEPRSYGGDLALYLCAGALWVRAGEEGQTVCELRPQDAFYLPQGVKVQFFNYGAEPCSFMVGIAPHYLSTGS